jgi:hypothetical protein
MMSAGVDCYDFCCLSGCEAVMTAPDLRTLVATGRKAIAATIQPVWNRLERLDSYVQPRKNNVQTIREARDVLSMQ